MSPSIAGATTTGRRRREAPWRSPRRRDRPPAIAASQWAVAGATTIASALSAMTMWPMRRSGSRSSTSVSTGWRDRAANDSGPTKRVADGVSMTDDVGALGAQQADQLDGLVGGDRAGDAEPDEPAGEPAAVDGGHDRPSSRRSPPVDLGMQDGEALEGQLRVDGVDARRCAVAHGAADSPPVRIALTSPGSTPASVRQLARGSRASRPSASAW